MNPYGHIKVFDQLELTRNEPLDNRMVKYNQFRYGGPLAWIPLIRTARESLLGGPYQDGFSSGAVGSLKRGKRSDIE